MLNRRWLRILAALLGLALVAAACGNDDDDTTDTGDDPNGEEAAPPSCADSSGGVPAPTDAENVRVGLVYDIGGRGDQSFNDAAAAGLDQAADELGVTTQDLEPAGSGEDREELLRTLADDGYDLIIGVGFAFAEAIASVSSDFDETAFAIIDDGSVQADNLVCLVFAEEQGSFLVGAAAALTSESGQLGFIGGVEIDLIQKFEAGFVAGAEAADPDVSVEVRYISQPPDFTGFNDPARALELARGQISDGADVIYHAAGGSGGGLFSAAAEADGVWAIGVDSDQYLTAEPDVRDVILTSMLKRVDVAVFEAIQAFVNGELEAGLRSYDLSNEGVGYSTSGDFLSAEVLSQLEQLQSQIASGEITVPTS